MGNDGKVMLNARNMCGMWQQKGYTAKGKNILNYGIYFKSNRKSLTDFYQRMTCTDLCFGKTILKAGEERIGCRNL